MNKIVKSLSVIAFVAAIAIGATSAYFSDEEKSTGNTFTAGTIDIAIDGTNPWSTHYDIPDLKPGETGYINFNIQNVGQNPVNVSKNLSNWNASTGLTGYACPNLTNGNYNGEAVSSEPECVEARAHGTDVNDVQTQILYDLSVKVYAQDNDNTPIWWQTIYTGANGETLSSVYPSDQTYVALGMIPRGGHMLVTQSYHFNPQAGNEYQGDTLSFDITIKGEQLPQGNDGMTTVALENKVQGQNDIWDIVQGDNIDGTLSYKVQNPTFDYTFTGRVATTGSYILLYVGTTNNYPGNGSVALGAPHTFTANTADTITGSVALASGITNGKIWLIPESSYVGGVMTSWPAADILFETGLINYVKN